MNNKKADLKKILGVKRPHHCGCESTGTPCIREECEWAILAWLGVTELALFSALKSNLTMQNIIYTVKFRRGSRGRGARGPCPPQKIWGKNKGAKNHTHRQKKRSKSDNHEARYRLKHTPKHTKYAKIF